MCHRSWCFFLEPIETSIALKLIGSVLLFVCPFLYFNYLFYFVSQNELTCQAVTNKKCLKTVKKSCRRSMSGILGLFAHEAEITTQCGCAEI